MKYYCLSNFYKLFTRSTKSSNRNTVYYSFYKIIQSEHRLLLVLQNHPIRTPFTTRSTKSSNQNTVYYAFYKIIQSEHCLLLVLQNHPIRTLFTTRSTKSPNQNTVYSKVLLPKCFHLNSQINQ
jgi:hypothetical protein